MEENVFLQLERCTNMIKVISDIMAHWYDMWNIIIVAINFCNTKKINWTLMFIFSNHYGKKCLINLLQLEPCNDMIEVISDIWHIVMIYEILLSLQSIFAMQRKWIVHWCLSLAKIMEENVSVIYYSEIYVMTYLKWFLTKWENWYGMRYTIINIAYCNAKKMNCALMLIISIQYGRKCLSHSLNYAMIWLKWFLT